MVQVIEVTSSVNRISACLESLLVQTVDQVVLFRYDNDAHRFLQVVTMPLFTSQSHLTLVADRVYAAIEN